MLGSSANFVPADTKASIDAYVKDRAPIGGFLYAVLSDDLFEACGRADENNAKCLFGIVRYIWNNAPPECHGSQAKVRAWLKVRLDALRKQAEDGNESAGGAVP